MKKLERQDIIDILYGCTILGTGGGGSLVRGIELIDKALAQNKAFVLADFDELDGDDLIATPIHAGLFHRIRKKKRRNINTCRSAKKYRMSPRLKRWKTIWVRKSKPSFPRSSAAEIRRLPFIPQLCPEK